MMMIQLALFILNSVLALINYDNENYGIAMFSSCVAGLCLGFLISLIQDAK